MIAQKESVSSADTVLRQIEQVSERRFLPIVGPRKGAVLGEEVRRAKPKRVLEVGTLIGYSAILIGKELGEDAEIVTIEVHKDEVELARENIRRANLPVRVYVMLGNALELISRLRGPFDFAFIDAEKNEYFQYLRLVEDRLVEGCVVVADNAGIFVDAMKDYLDYVRNSGKYKSRYVQVGNDGLEISVKL